MFLDISMIEVETDIQLIPLESDISVEALRGRKANLLQHISKKSRIIFEPKGRERTLPRSRYEMSINSIITGAMKQSNFQTTALSRLAYSSFDRSSPAPPRVDSVGFSYSICASCSFSSIVSRLCL